MRRGPPRRISWRAILHRAGAEGVLSTEDGRGGSHLEEWWAGSAFGSFRESLRAEPPTALRLKGRGWKRRSRGDASRSLPGEAMLSRPGARLSDWDIDAVWAWRKEDLPPEDPFPRNSVDQIRKERVRVICEILAGPEPGESGSLPSDREHDVGGASCSGTSPRVKLRTARDCVPGWPNLIPPCTDGGYLHEDHAHAQVMADFGWPRACGRRGDGGEHPAGHGGESG